MKIAYVLHGYPPTHNAGAEWYAHRLMRWFAARGHPVLVLVAGSRGRMAQDFDGIPVHAFAQSALTHADVVLTHLDATKTAQIAAQAAAKPLVHVLHNDRQLDFHKIRHAAAIVANSSWVAETVPRRFGTTPRVVVYPSVDLEVPRSNGDRLTLVNLTAAKGVDTFYRLAQALPARRFLAVKGAYGQQVLPRRSNVKVVANTADMAPVWAETGIYCQPSSYESFGLAAVEAMAHGIPVIAHPTPGLVESLDKAGIFANRDRPGEWVQAVETMDHPPAAERARTRAEELAEITGRQRLRLEATLAAIVR